MLRTSVEYGRLLNNPSEKVRLKRRRARGPKPFLRIEQFYLLLEAIAEPYATIVYVAVFTALRISELAGLMAEHLYHLDYHRGAVQPWRFRSAQITGKPRDESI